MTPDAFTASLQRSAAEHPPSKARRIAALLPQIEAAMAQGSPRSHIVTALLDVGIEITPHQLSNVIARLRRQRADAPGASLKAPALVETNGLQVESSSANGAGTGLARPKVASAHAPAPPNAAAPGISPASKFGTHDPRLLDEVMRSTPDMKALAKLAPKHPNGGKP